MLEFFQFALSSWWNLIGVMVLSAWFSLCVTFALVASIGGWKQ